MRKFTAEDLTRVLCAVDERILAEALHQRERQCPTTWELLIAYFQLIMLVLRRIPLVGYSEQLIGDAIRLVGYVETFLWLIGREGVVIPALDPLPEAVPVPVPYDPTVPPAPPFVPGPRPLAPPEAFRRKRDAFMKYLPDI